MNAPRESLAQVLSDLAVIGKRLVETSEKAVALLARDEAECRRDENEPVPSIPMPIEKPTTLLTQAQIVDLLQVGTRTLARLRSDPAAKFPRPIKRARVLRWRRRDIEAWLEARR